MIPGYPLEVHDSLQVRTGSPDASCIYDSCVEEMAADELLISWPVREGELVAVREHQVLTLSFLRPQGLYEFEAVVVEMLGQPVPLLAVRPSTPLRSIERRDNFRLNAVTPVELTAKVVKMASFRKAGSSGRPIRTETLSISAGGFTILHPTPLRLGAIFDVRLVIPGDRNQPLTAAARAVRCLAVQATGSGPQHYELGFAFSRISEANRTRIIRFVFNAQREKLRAEE